MSNALVMYDSANPGTLPPWDGEFAVAGYVDGYTDFPAIRAAYPRARVLSITGHNGIAECADIEDYLMSDSDAPGFYHRARARGVAVPKLYRQASSAAGLIQVMASAGIGRGEYRIWSAHYEWQPHLCGHITCGYPQADATQWTSSALGRQLDQSLLTADFFGTPAPPPANWTFGPPRNLAAAGGRTSVRLEWEPPAGAPETPAEYQVYVYQGSACNRTTLVASYPRITAATLWEGGSLERGKSYTAHVVASGPGGTRVAPYVFASAFFATS
jgi:hypothetical protein